MTERLGFGVTVGAVASAVAWNANRAPHTVSTFPDGLTLAVLAVLTFAGVWLHCRRSRPASAAAFLKAGGVLGATAGLVFGTVMAILGAVRFSQFAPTLLAFAFLTAFLSSLACGVAASAWLWVTTRTARAVQPAAAADRASGVLSVNEWRRG